MTEPLTPYPSDPMAKFRSGPPCVPGGAVIDTSTSFSGDEVCSMCRGQIVLEDGIWVHALTPLKL